LTVSRTLERNLAPLSLTPSLYHSFHEELHLATCADINLREIMKGYFNVAYLRYEQGVIDSLRKGSDQNMDDGEGQFNFLEIEEFNNEVSGDQVVAVRSLA